MAMQELIILGKSEAVITMILDNLESRNVFPDIKIINNLRLPSENPFENPLFKIEILEILDRSSINTPYILGVGKVYNKVKIMEYFGIDSAKFINVVHSFSAISSTARLGNGCLVNSMVSVAAYAEIGNFVTINRNASIGHHTTVSDFVTIHPGAIVAGNIFIGANTQIGMGAAIVDGTRIGEGSIIGAGSLVTKDVPDNVMVYGSPAKIIKEL